MLEWVIACFLAVSWGLITPSHAMRPHSEKAEVTEPVPFNSSNTIFIFDWDDTLFPSSALEGILGKGYGGKSWNFGDELHKALTEHSTIITHVLIEAMSLGQVYIVTNATAEWVHLTASKFLPNLPVIPEGVQILSARTTFEMAYPDNPRQWKIRAFQRITRAAESRPLNIISMGDSLHEREAAWFNRSSEVYSKNIKFIEQPTLEHLKRQWELWISVFSDITDHPDHLDLMNTITSLDDRGIND